VADHVRPGGAVGSASGYRSATSLESALRIQSNNVRHTYCLRPYDISKIRSISHVVSISIRVTRGRGAADPRRSSDRTVRRAGLGFRFVSRPGRERRPYVGQVARIDMRVRERGLETIGRA
jgi:hypothetical protein